MRSTYGIHCGAGTAARRIVISIFLLAGVIVPAAADTGTPGSRPAAVTRSGSALAGRSEATMSVRSVVLGSSAAGVVYGGQTIAGVVTLDVRAPADGAVVKLWTSAAGTTSVPETVIVPPFSDRASFTVTSTRVSTLVRGTISAAVTGATTSGIADGSSRTILIGETPAQASATLDVLPLPRIVSITTTPGTVAGGQSFFVRLGVDQLPPSGVPAPPPPSVTLTSSRPGLVSLPQSSPLVPDPTVLSTTQPVQVAIAGSTGSPTADETVTITATFDNSSLSTQLVVRAPAPPIASLTVSPTSVAGGADATGTITMNQTLSPLTATLSSSHPALVRVPESLTIGRSSLQTFRISTVAVRVTTVVTIKLVAGQQSLAATLTLTPLKQEDARE